MYHLKQMLIFLLLRVHFGGQQFLNGKVESINSEILNQKRDLFIYLPQDYQSSTATYPVHFVTDAPKTANLFNDLI